MFLTHYYPPESNAPANRVSELAREWVMEGHRVTVVTCTPSHPGGRPYPGYRNPLFRIETLDGVDVIRIGTMLAANRGKVRRSLNYVSFLISVVLQAWRLPPADVVISTSPQFFAGIAGYFAAKRLGAPWVLEVRDIWPESVAAVAAGGRGLIFRLLEQIERWAYRTADQIVVVSPAFIDHIVACSRPRRPVRTVENGVDLSLFTVQETTDFRAQHGLSGKVVFGYIGTHGMAHSLETVLHAANLTRNDRDIGYLLVGSGAERDRLISLCETLDLPNLTMLDHQPRSAMPIIWSSIDVSLVVLRDSAMFRRVIPSKMFEAMAMERPIVMAVDGQAREILERGGCGTFVEPENPAALAAIVRAYARDEGLRARHGAAGGEFVRANYDRSVLARRYLEILKPLCRGMRMETGPGHISAADGVRPRARGSSAGYS
jgi:glycosyltransferase involved in cell wall biosynthesis